MQIKSGIGKENQIEMFAAALILLFVYAGATKIMDHHNFQVELSKSPLLVDIAHIVAWVVPASEIAVAVSLIFSLTRLAGFYASFGFMLTFTLYIISILTYSEYIPCTCGGVLSKLGWKSHLVFNLVFVVMALSGILVLSRRRIKFFLISGITAISTATVVALYVASYDEPNKYSSFEKIQLMNSPEPGKDMDVGINSYYFAGVSLGHIYLSNQLSPNLLVNIDPVRRTFTREKIDNTYPVTNFARTRVIDGEFFIGDGTIPQIVTGSLQDLQARRTVLRYDYFNEFIPISNRRIVFRKSDSSAQSTLAIATPDSGLVEKRKILTRQLDGKFCVDGIMTFNPETKQFIYTYFYRNRFITVDTMLASPRIRVTLDSISHARIKVNRIETKGVITSVVVPELLVNSQLFTAGNFLFLRSNIRARNESSEVFAKSPRIDVFDLHTGQYMGSFNLALATGERPREFLALHQTLYALVDERIITFDLKAVLEECESTAIKRFYRPVE